MKRTYSTGFTLIELITVITLSGIVALLAARGLSRPIQGFVDLGTRAALVDGVDLALSRLSREVRLALPNSVRLRDGATPGLATCSASGGGICAVEILRTLDGGRYRLLADGTDNDVCAADADPLNFTATSDCFEVLGPLGNTPAASPGADQTDCRSGAVDCLVIFNTGQSLANAYNGDNMAGIQSLAVNGMSEVTGITFDIGGGAASNFPFESPRQRFHIVDQPVSFVCNTATGLVTRHGGYAITAAQSAAPGGAMAVLIDRVESCAFTYAEGSNSRNGLLIVSLTVSDLDTEGDTNRVTLVEQIQVPNVP